MSARGGFAICKAIRIIRSLEKVEESLEVGAAVALGGWLRGCGKAGQKGEHIVGGWEIDLPFNPERGYLIDLIAFKNSAGDSATNYVDTK